MITFSPLVLWIMIGLGRSSILALIRSVHLLIFFRQKIIMAVLPLLSAMSRAFSTSLRRVFAILVSRYWVKVILNLAPILLSIVLVVQPKSSAQSTSEAL